MSSVLLLNLGSPDAPSVPAVRRYLRKFLGDPNVISLPWILRKFLLEAVILPRRTKKSAVLYQRVWTKEGSPLIAGTERLRARVEAELDGNVPVFCAMRYGNPSVDSAIQKMRAAGIKNVFVIPLYPQRAESSWETAVEHARKFFRKRAPEIALRFADPFFDEPDFIAALAEKTQAFLSGKKFEKLLISFHGVPVKTRLAQSYRAECETTARLLAEALNLPQERWECVFQSRFGKGKWLEPNLEDRLKNLPAEGVKNLALVAPGFCVDCLETLDELGVRGREKFLAHGGNALFAAPCLNDSPAFARFLARLAETASPSALRSEK